MTEDTPGASRPARSLGACGVNRISTSGIIVNWEFGRKATFREDLQGLAAALTSFDQGSELFKVVDDKIRTRTCEFLLCERSSGCRGNASSSFCCQNAI